MNTSSSSPNIGHEARALLKSLQESFPVLNEHAPLAIGIDKQIIAKIPAINKKILRVALNIHTNSLRYLKTIEKAAYRVDLDGNNAEELSAEHRKYAADVLRERFKKNAERRKAQREAEEAERQRTEKLSQLVEKFGKTK